jgi:hypothetical protein
MTCEKCWADAYKAARLLGGDQVEHYHRLLRERAGAPCTSEQQRGDAEALAD